MNSILNRFKKKPKKKTLTRNDGKANVKAGMRTSRTNLMGESFYVTEKNRKETREERQQRQNPATILDPDSDDEDTEAGNEAARESVKKIQARLKKKNKSYVDHPVYGRLRY